jgi:hypothetical protein
MRSVLAATALSFGLALPSATTPVRADEITDQLDQAKQYYGEGDVTGAIAELEFALQAMRGKIGQELLSTFPEPPAGWTVEDGGDKQQAGGTIPMLGSGTMLSRTYMATAGDASIEAQLMSGGGFLQGIAGMFLNPQVMAAQPNAKRVRIGRENAVATYDASERSSQLVLDLGGKATIMLQGHQVDGSDPLIALAEKWDLKKVKELVGG